MSGSDWMNDIQGPESVIVWSGAGLSVDAPTGGPQGNELTYRALDNLFFDVDADEIEGWFKRASMPASVPRLETVLSVVRSFFRDEAVAWLLADLHQASQRPNDLHRFSAEHLAVGGRHVTANVDRCIESASKPNTPSPLHFHGVMDPHGSTAGLGLVLENIEDGFLPGVKQVLARVLTATPNSTLLIVGYSGSDYFDVLPFLSELPPWALQGMSVIWCQFHPRVGLTRMDAAELDDSARTMLRALEESGATISVISGALRSVFGELARKWGLTPVPASTNAAAPAPWTEANRPAHVTQDGRETASLGLYARLGLPNLLLNYLDGHSGVDLDQMAAEIGEAHRTAGNPSEFMRWAARAWPGSEPNPSIMREERRVQALRGAGYFHQAFMHAARTARRAEQLSAQLDPAVHLAAIDAATSTLYDRYRLPLGPLLPHRSQALRLRAQLESLDRIAGSDLSLRLGRIRRDLETILGTPRTTELDQSAMTIHQQASSVIRTLNYRQGLLRTPGHTDEEACQSLRELQDTWVAMGQYAEAARLSSSPLAIRALGLPEVLVTLLRAAHAGHWSPLATARFLTQSVFAHATRTTR